MAALSSFTPLLVVFSALVSSSLCVLEDELTLQARLTPCELVRYMGYPCEISHVTTDDGYVLEVDRVPHGLNGSAPGSRNHSGRYPVLFVAPLAAASDVYFINYPSQSPGFLFADAGFDVWAANTRESIPYAYHKTFSRFDPRYSRWSFDEIGRYDVAAAIDHVLNVTGASKLTLLGYSQGCVISLVLLSTRPEYNDKVDLFVAYGPVANATYMEPPLSLLWSITPQLLFVLDPLSIGGYLGSAEALQKILTAACRILSGDICSLSTTLTLLSSPSQLNETRAPVYLGHYPIGTSYQNFRHYSQVYRARNFVMYDHGRIENRRRYGQNSPPPYPLERITTRVALFSSPGDTAADPRDVADLVARLGDAVVFHRVVTQQPFRHMDFSVSYKANDFLHNTAIDVTRKYATRSN